MSKQQLLTAVEEGDKAAFLKLLAQHNDKRSLVDLGEVVTELNHSQLDKVWTVLHLWASDQLKKFIESAVDDEADVPEQEPSENGPPDVPPQVNEPEVQDKGKKSDSAESEENQMEVTESKIQSDQVGSEAQLSDDNRQKDVLNQNEPYNEQLIVGVVQFASIHICTIKGFGSFIPEMLLELAVLLYGVVSVLQGQLHAEVVKLCEVWWHRELDEREALISYILPILIETAISKSGRKKDVLAVWNIRGALDVVEFDEPLVKLLVATAASPQFLKCEEGCRWIAELFTRQVLVSQLHRSIKKVLPECTKDQSGKYGDVYFRAWKKTTGDVQHMIEESCIQDLMYAAVHVDPFGGKLSTNLHHLLHYIHRQKHHHVVEKMILSLYNPFLWRSMKVANGYVRMNAAGLLCDAFPLADSSCSLEERQELLDKQYQTIISLLTDPCHLVRITTIKGTCIILNNYWLVIPSQVIKSIFKIFLTQLICDSSSTEVRAQVIKGLTLILDNNDAIPFMKEVLPRISASLDDISVNVRTAFAHLLLKVKALKIIKYWTIVPITHLLHVLEDDSPPVCKLLTQLLLNSFHPAQKEDHELLQRCLVLLKENRAAARRFYQYASRTIDLRSTVEFLLLICRCIRNYIITQQSQDTSRNSEDPDDCGSSDTGEQAASSRQGNRKGTPPGRKTLSGKRVLKSKCENKENKMPGQKTLLATSQQESVLYQKDSGTKGTNDDDDESPLDDPDVLGGLFDTIVILWSSNAHRLALPQNVKYLEILRREVSKHMPLFFKFFKEKKDVSQTLLYLASFLPKTLVPTLVGHCLSRLRSLQQDQDHEDSYVTYINALCNWNRVDDVLELATDWLVEGFHSATTTSPKERRLSRRGVQFQETCSPQPSLALRLVLHILQHPLNKLNALNRNRSLMLDLADTLKTSKDLIEERLNRSDEFSNLCSDKFLCEAWSVYLRLVVVLHNPTPEKPPRNEAEEELAEEEGRVAFDSSNYVQDCLDWATRLLLPILNTEAVGEKRKLRAGDEAVEVSIQALLDLVKACNNLIIIGAADAAFVLEVCGFTDTLLKSDACENFWECSLLVALEAHQYLKVYRSAYNEDVEGVIMPVDLINSCVTSLAGSLNEDRALPKDAEKLDKTLGNVLATMCQTRSTQTEIFQHLIATVLDFICTQIEKANGIDSEIKTVENMGGCVGLLLGICLSRVKLSSFLMEALTDFISDSVLDSTMLLTVTFMLKVLSKDSGKISKYSIKQGVGAVDNLLAGIIVPASLDFTPEEGERTEALTQYEKYAKTAREIVDDLKSTLGVI